MAMTDPIADMLTRIRNANKERLETTSIPASTKKIKILEIIKEEGFIKDFKVVTLENNKSNILVTLKYKENRRVISGIKRISKPGRRVYVDNGNIPYVFNGLGTAIITTSKGVMTDRQARKENIGGEVIAYIW
ncbi:MAG: 30S ribosomal protein S8 [Mycoplasmatales bacterium]